METFVMTLAGILVCIIALVIYLGIPIAIIYYLIKKARK